MQIYILLEYMTTFECPSKDRENDDYTEGANTDMLTSRPLTSWLDIL